jgi:PRTRC genetic system protein E
MFRELMPILEGRTLMLTLSRVNESAIRVCVIPKRLKEDSGENGLCMPLTVTGTADELDREFAAQLSGYTAAVIKLGSNLAAIEAAHDAAVKTVEEERKKDLDRKRGKVSGSKANTGSATQSQTGPAIKDGKPVFGTKNREESGPAMSLFDAPGQTATAVHQQSGPALETPEAESAESIAEEPPMSSEEPATTVPDGSSPGASGSFAFSYPD